MTETTTHTELRACRFCGGSATITVTTEQRYDGLRRRGRRSRPHWTELSSRETDPICARCGGEE